MLARSEALQGHRQRNAAQHRARRADPERRADEQRDNTAAHQAARADPERRADEQRDNTAAHQAARADPERRAAEQRTALGIRLPGPSLQYLPLAVLVRPFGDRQPEGVLTNIADYASRGAAFAVVPRPSEEAHVAFPAPQTGTITKRVKRINVPLGDAYALTDFGVQGFSFGNRCFVVDLTVPPRGIKRATLFVLLTRYKDFASVRLLRPLFTTEAGLEEVVDKFMAASELSVDLTAELRLLQRAADETRQRYAADFAYAQSLADRRNPLPP
jgi:hypothetical protein